MGTCIWLILSCYLRFINVLALICDGHFGLYITTMSSQKCPLLNVGQWQSQNWFLWQRDICLLSPSTEVWNLLLVRFTVVGNNNRPSSLSTSPLLATGGDAVGQLASQVKEVLPHVPLDVIRRDLGTSILKARSHWSKMIAKVNFFIFSFFFLLSYHVNVQFKSV